MGIITGMKDKSEKATCKSLEKYLLEILTDSRKKSNICFPALETVPSVLTMSLESLCFSKISGSVNSICT